VAQYVIAKPLIEFGTKKERHHLYWTASKGKSRTEYWGQYIGTEGKRYGAVRFKGGVSLDRLLSLPGNRDLVAIEVKA
jgi:hypothetical protein